MKTREKVQMTNAELKTKVLEVMSNNHIWINAFSLINPSEETLLGIGATVVDMLKQRENLLPSYHGYDDDDEVSDIAKLTPTLYLHINAS